MLTAANITPSQPSAVDLPQSPSRPFAADARILIVDDNLHTAEQLALGLAAHYGMVEFTLNPTEGITKIREAAASCPYSAIVLDLWMPNLTGFDVLQRLGENLPPVVISTASLLAPAVARMSAALDSSRDDSSALLLHLKPDGIDDLVCKLDRVLQAPAPAIETSRAFISTFEPRLVGTHFSAALVHEFAEELRNFVVRIQPVVEEFLTTDEPYRSPNSKQGLEWGRALEHLSRSSFTALMGETPRNTLGNMHEALFNVGMLRAPTFGATSEKAEAAHSSWKELHDAFQQLLQGIYRKFEEYHCSYFSIQDLLCSGEQRLAESVYSSSGDPSTLAQIKDPERQLRNFLTQLSVWVNRHKDIEPDAGLSCVIAYNAAGPSSASKANPKQPFDSYYSIVLADNLERDWDHDISSWAPQLGDLRRAGLASYTIVNPPGRRFFTLNVNAEETLEPLPSKDQNINVFYANSGPCLVPTKSGALLVHQGLGDRKNIDVIGSLPTELPNMSKAMFVKVGEKLIFASADQHYLAAQRIADYLSVDAAEMIEVDSVYKAAIRMLYRRESMYCDGSNHASDAWLAEGLQSLGLPANKVIWDAAWFASRPI